MMRLLAAGTLLGLVAWAVWPEADDDGQAAAGEATAERGLPRVDSGPEVTRHAAGALRSEVPDALPGGGAGPDSEVSPLQTLLLCLRTDYDGPTRDSSDFRDPEECIDGFDVRLLTEQELGRLIGDRTINPLGAVLLLQQWLHLLQPGDVLPRMQALSRYSDDDYWPQMVFRSAVRRIAEDDPAWADSLARSLLGSELFHERGTCNGLAVAEFLATLRPELAAILDSGAHGDWGGQDDVVAHAVELGCRRRREEGADSLMAFVDSVLASPRFTERTAAYVGQSVFLELIQYGDEEPLASQAIEERLWRILEEPRFARGMAVQLSGQGFWRGADFLDAATRERMKQRAEDVLNSL